MARRSGYHDPLAGRPGLIEEGPETNALAKELGQLARKHGLAGCVLLSFKGDRVGVNSSGTGEFGHPMKRLADLVLARFDDGDFDAALAEGRDNG